MPNPCFAIVDDDTEFASMTLDMARRRGFTAHAFHRVADAAPWLARHDPELTLLDMHLPDGTGFDVLERIPVQHQGQIVFVSGSSDIEHARRAVASAASAYLPKPLPPTRLMGLLDDVRQSHHAREAALRDDGDGLLGESPPMQALRQEIARAAPHDVSVLLFGETGSGKELAARAIHAQSGRGGRFVAVNCGALPGELLASELFGHERGSFTGAAARHLGFFEQAQGGTLFLDEIGDMPPALQVYLLRALETGVVQRIGGQGEVPIDVRVIAATHRLSADGCGDLRQDLYFRLVRYPIEVPPLRARKQDIPLLATAFVDRLNRRTGHARRLEERCLPGLMAHAWPGNVRELSSAIELAYLRSQDDSVRAVPLQLDRRGLPGDDDPASVRFQVGMTFAQVEAEMLRKTLAFHAGDKTATARALGISVRTVHNHLARKRDDV
ncbi:sigma-54-dependent transcriptional regulator [Pseudoxanthomonas sp. 22568]|jgi:DNA-binding NtrC family response regulator|uniref:sigma-54-dependent transcriptional regulator n=1 Tax=Pseudoxanthomonas TaxID=83618 RepID=UPI00177C5CBB|nr:MULTISPECIES: sigma-54 dependent transcriptional regulator [Pseudoxanthomonas]MBD9378004.1 sigma-54-dependent Fis family transcriptional regulator [Pseudoxanthomonas sp. PXM04]UBB26934.1 sigma-54 dependent transcriptional regulator [Pseudoxanthomonas japonensis]